MDFSVQAPNNLLSGDIADDKHPCHWLLSLTAQAT
jgi:hypothetical protein